MTPASIFSAVSTAMHSSLLSPTLFSPYKPRCLLTQRGNNLRVLICGRRLVGGRVSGGSDMTEMARAKAFGGGQREEAEAEAAAVVGRKVQWREFEAVLNRMSKWLVAALFGLTILWKHDAEALWAAMGSVVNSVISTSLKQMLNHQRPASALRSDPGMPSSHAQSIFYAASYAVLSLFQWLGYDALTMSVGTLILMSASYLTWLRVSQKLHTVSQVLVGTILGAACGFTWHWLWLSFMQAAFISSIWARIFVVLGSFTFCAGFTIHVVQHWLIDEQ